MTGKAADQLKKEILTEVKSRVPVESKTYQVLLKYAPPKFELV